ncbi:ATP-binding protein [Chitinimonas sp. BJYL2]|uniref:ATP-binding protein n=1 Tax=Chitinimonas sp. BJYL2 TaxID=2976696 RepID=UPI0022B2C019|nr:ATP-binding protein [Chitinimonas sp. BJYL2]
MTLLPDTIRGRLFGLVLAALVISHFSFGMIAYLNREHFSPADFPRQHEREPRPAELRGGPPPMMVPGLPRRDRGFPLVGLGVQFLILAAAAWYGSRWLVRPIESLAQASAQLGDNLHSPPMPETGPQEMRLAARTLNHMQRQIIDQLAERTRFLAAVSHDLRTPLTRIKLRIEQLDNPELAQRLRDDVGEMSTMLDGTLDYLRGESREEAWQSLDLGALLQTLVDDAVEQGQQASLHGDAPIILAQPGTLRRGLQNLINNAVRYGGDAEVSLSVQGERLCIEVRDHGPGIPEADLERVLEPFVRLESSRNRTSGGTGLGLSIARDAALRHGGELRLRNAPDGGLIARLCLPLRQNASIQS